MLVNIGLWASPELFGDFGGEGRDVLEPAHQRRSADRSASQLDGLPAWPLFETLVGAPARRRRHLLRSSRSAAARQDVEADAATGEAVIG